MNEDDRAREAVRVNSTRSPGFQKNQAHLDGMRAYELGGREDENPYHNWLAESWCAGFREAKDRDAEIRALSS